MDVLTAPALSESRLRRIAGMSLAELRCRSRQEGSKLLDRLRGDASRDARATLARCAPVLVDADTALAQIRTTFDARFFAGTQQHAIANHGAVHVAAIVEEADRLMQGRFDLLGYRDLSFGAPIDWHLDPVWSRRSPQLHWSQINALDPDVVGDSKVVWELNRHQWMIRLAQATACTGDPVYGTRALDEIRNWIDANPVGRGINWASSLEVALRVMSWSWVLGLLRHSTLLAGSTLTTMLASLHAHASHIQRYLSHYYSPNTHLTGEALGLVYAGCLYPQFTAASRWLDTGVKTLIAESDRQITTDGVYIEQSTCYQRYTADIFLQFMLLAARSGVDVPPSVRERTTRLVEFLSAISDQRGSMPDIGDADGGWLLPLVRREPDDCRGTLAVAAVVLGRPDMACTSEPEALWLTATRSTVTPAAPRRSQLFEVGGYAVLRSQEHELIVDVGPLGCYGHGHADLLSVQCRIFGEPCLVDAGTYGYTAEPEWRDYFRGTAAHNTIVVDGRSQAAMRGPFGWQSRPAVTVREWQSVDGIDVVEAEHQAYNDVTHRRRALATPAGVFVVIDDILGEGRHTVELTFQFAPIDVSLVSGTTARATTPAGHHLWITPFSSTPLSADIVSGRTAPKRGWVSPAYGRKVPAPALIYSSDTTLPARIVTVLHPQHSSCAA